MAKDVKIPVKVEGDEQAKQKLKDVGGAVEQVGQAGKASTSGLKEHAAAHEQAAGATKQTTQATQQFDHAAKTATIGILGRLHPTLGALGALAVNVAKGLKGISLGLLGMVGLGAAIGGIITYFERLAEKAREAEEQIRRVVEAEREWRTEDLAKRRELAKALLAAGVEPSAVPRAARTEQILRKGLRLPEAWAGSGAVAQAVAGLSQAEVLEYLRGVAVTGGEPPRLAGPRPEMLQQIGRLRAQGSTVAGRRFLESFQLATAEDPLDRFIKELKQKQPELSPRDIEIIQALASGADIKVFEQQISFWHRVHAGLSAAGATRPGTYRAVARRYQPPGATRMLFQLQELANQVERQALEDMVHLYSAEARADRERAATDRPLIIDQRTHFNTALLLDPMGVAGRPWKPAPDFAEGGPLNW